MGRKSKAIFLSFILGSFLLGAVVAQEVAKSESEALGEAEKRETLEIIIGGGGGGGGSPAPSPSSPPPYCPPTRLEKAKRVLLRFATLIDDPNCYTQTWTEDRDVCDFRGVRCATYPDDKQLAVAGLDLNGAAVSGKNGCPLPLKGILDSIPELTFFHVNSNNFTNGVPNGIASFKYFFELDLSNNKIATQFPMEAIQNNQLVFLDLRFNKLTGSIPSQLFQRDLDVIFVNNNQFTGCLPQNFGSTPARYLTFANNSLTGPLPASIGHAPNLTEVLFLRNHFDGCLPVEIGNLKKAVVFDASENQITGPIPLSFGCLKSIQYLSLQKNKLYGCVPDNLCQIPSIRNNGNLYLGENYFNDIGPSCWTLIQSKVLDVSRNCIPGLPNQRSQKECYLFYKSKKTCPNPNSFYYVPCKSHWGTQSKPTAPPSKPVTYKALKPHRFRL